jgi:hypothetical protein
MGPLCPRELYEGNLEEGLLYWGAPKGMLRLWKWASVSTGVPLLGNIKGRSSPRPFERREKFLYLGRFL